MGFGLLAANHSTTARPAQGDYLSYFPDFVAGYGDFPLAFLGGTVMLCLSQKQTRHVRAALGGPSQEGSRWEQRILCGLSSTFSLIFRNA
jgi:hypothetical protein